MKIGMLYTFSKKVSHISNMVPLFRFFIYLRQHNDGFGILTSISV